MATQTSEDLAEVFDVQGMADVKDKTSLALQSQYSASPRIKALGAVFQEALDPTPEAFELAKQFNVKTAQGVFLDAIGKRVGIDRYVEVKGDRYALSDERYRFLIMYQASANISNASASDLNRLLSSLMRQNVWVSDGLDMTIDVHFLGNPNPEDVALLKSLGLLMRGAGVGYNTHIIPTKYKNFGFDGSGLTPFDTGPMFDGTLY